MNNKSKSFYLLIITIILISFILQGCGIAVGMSESSTHNKMSASFLLLSETAEKSITLQNGDTIKFDYKIKLDMGELSAKFFDSDKNVVCEFKPNTNGKKEISIKKNGTYILIIKSNKAKGSYKFNWNVDGYKE